MSEQTSARLDAERAAEKLLRHISEYNQAAGITRFHLPPCESVAEIILRETTLESLEHVCKWVRDFACKECGHLPVLSSPPEGAIVKTVADLKSRLESAEKAVKWPDIGLDPLRHSDEVKGGVEGALERLRAGTGLQQKEVPDQTMLAWRIDVERVICELTVMSARWKHRQDDVSNIQSLEKRNAELEGRVLEVIGRCENWQNRDESTPEQDLQSADETIRQIIARATALLPEQSGKEFADDAAAQLAEDKRAYESERMAGLRDIHQSGKEAV